MNIVLINHYAGSPRHGMEYRPYYLAREWAALGHQVTIVAATASHVRSRAVEGATPIARELIDGIQYVWLKTPAYEGNGIRRVLNMLTFVGRLFTRGRRGFPDSKPDLVIASSTYPLDIFPARRMARAASARLVFEVHDLWPLSPMELGGMSRWHPFILMMQVAEDYAYRHADKVVSMLPKADTHMRRHGMAQAKFVYIPNGVDVSEWTQLAEDMPEGHRKTFDRLRAEGRAIIGYAGAHGLANALDCLLDSAGRLREVQAAFVLVGQGPEKERLARRVKDERLDHVVFLDPVHKRSIPALLGSMDICYIGLQRQPLFRFGVSPNKLMDYMMAAKPVLYAVAAGNDPVAESGCGLSVPAQDPGASAGALMKLLAMGPSEWRRMGERGRAHVMREHDYPVLARRFLEQVNWRGTGLTEGQT